MAIEFVGAQTASIAASTATNTTITFALTGGIDTVPRDGDYVIVSYSVASTVDRAIGVISTGYLEVAELYSSDSFDANLSVNVKRMLYNPDTSVVIGPTGSTADSGAVLIQVFRGVHPSTPLDVAVTTAIGANTGAPNPPAANPSTLPDCIAVLIGAAGTPAGTVFTAYYLNNFAQVQNTAYTNDASVGGGWIGVTQGVAYNGAAWNNSPNINTQAWAAVSLVLRPRSLLTYAVADFEEGTTGDFEAVNGAVSIVTGQGQVGTYCAAIAVNGFNNYAAVSNSFESKTLYAKTKFKLNKTANPTADTDWYGPIVRMGPAQGLLETRFRVTTAGVITLSVVNAVANGYVYFGPVTITPDTWYEIEFYIKINDGAANSEFSLKLNGTQLASGTNLNFGTARAIGLDLCSLSSNGLAGTIYYDEAYISTSPFSAGPTAGYVNAYNGSAFVNKPVKVWTGSAWTQKPVKFWSGSAWVLA